MQQKLRRSFSNQTQTIFIYVRLIFLRLALSCTQEIWLAFWSQKTSLGSKLNEIYLLTTSVCHHQDVVNSHQYQTYCCEKIRDSTVCRSSAEHYWANHCCCQECPTEIHDRAHRRIYLIQAQLTAADKIPHCIGDIQPSRWQYWGMPHGLLNLCCWLIVAVTHTYYKLISSDMKSSQGKSAFMIAQGESVYKIFFSIPNVLSCFSVWSLTYWRIVRLSYPQEHKKKLLFILKKYMGIASITYVTAFVILRLHFLLCIE